MRRYPAAPIGMPQVVTMGEAMISEHGVPPKVRERARVSAKHDVEIAGIRESDLFVGVIPSYKSPLLQ
jgi:hypothetical protein